MLSALKQLIWQVWKLHANESYKSWLRNLHKKIGSLFLSNSNLQMEIDSASESLTDSSPIGPATMSPRPSTAMDIIDELADRERRKRNIIFCNLPESSPNNKGDSDAFAVLCSSVYNSSLITITKSAFGKENS